MTTYSSNTAERKLAGRARGVLTCASVLTILLTLSGGAPPADEPSNFECSGAFRFGSTPSLSFATNFLPPDVTSSLEYLGDPVAASYSSPYTDKAGLFDLQLFGGKIYVGHGTSSSSRATKVIYVDPTTDTFGIDQDGSSNDVEFGQEMLRNMRVFDGELYFEGYDPLGSQTQIFRKEATGWVTYDIVSAAAHSRDVYKFGSRIFTNFGLDTAAFPRVYISEDNGASWTLPDQTSLYSGTSVVYDEFFEFDGELYLTGTATIFNPSTFQLDPTGQPFMLKFTGTTATPFGIAYLNRGDFIADNSGTEFVRRALTFDDKLFFLWGNDLYEATSIEPAVVQKIALPNQSGAILRDLIGAGSAVYALTRKTEGATYRYAVSAYVDGIGWKEWFNFTEALPITSFEYVNGAFYFGAGSQFNPENGSHVWKYTAGPVSATLSSFTAVNSNRDVALDWQTSSETGTAGFEIEHRTLSAFSSFAPVTFVDGAVDASSTQTYSHTLNQFEPGAHVFRLKIYGLDGTVTYSSEQQVVVPLCSF